MCGAIQCDQIWRNFAILAKNLTVFFNVPKVFLVFGSILNLFGIKFAIGKSFIVVNGQILTHLVTLVPSCVCNFLKFKPSMCSNSSLAMARLAPARRD